MKIVFKTKSFGFFAEMNDSPTAKEILKKLPINTFVYRWGDEIYVDTGIEAPSTGATLDLRIGDVAYWPEGKCLCVFFGPTIISTTEKPVPASPVVVIGRTMASPEELRRVEENEKINISAAQAESPASSYPADERKLTQSEIDVLVKQLLEAKKKPAGG
jgi:hypothetical protein